ncbi:uncharacterized protein LOC112351358 [Selaginella moellendorffii]|uniref:uncharacterized protein LOC112351358 n=1 Tax=Selaginella moellendorffii TaxID=88036 RepID=UPI000D1C3BE6|nr:uncharacterized protein LOC112351358 [Selaginella moellendorffii]|eukprot:XP_024544859.1 uncharacterized protein LOC112351358 [Selaginella moellendorffii]
MEEHANVDSLFKGVKVPPRLREAVDATLELRRVISAFRHSCFFSVEGGALFETIQAWHVKKYVPSSNLKEYPKDLEERNPYARYKTQFPKAARAWSSKLDFLLDEIPLCDSSLQSLERWTVSAAELEQLLLDLNDGGRLAPLITVCPYLTHLENVYMAVLDARLWLSYSELPVEPLRNSGSYKAIRMGSARPVRQLQGKPPSPFYALVMRREANNYLGMLGDPGSTVYYVTPMDFEPGRRGCYMARMSRLGRGFMRKRGMSPKKLAASLAATPIDDKEFKDRFLKHNKMTETSSMAKLLAHRIYDIGV